MDLIPNFMPLLGTADSEWAGKSIPDGPWEKMKSIPGGSAYYMTVGCMVPLLYQGGRRLFIMDNPPGPMHLVSFYDMQAGFQMSIIIQIHHGTPLMPGHTSVVTECPPPDF